MSDAVEAIRGAVALVIGGFIILVFAGAFADTALGTGPLPLSLVGIIAILGGLLVFVVVIAAIVSALLNSL